VKSPLTKQQIAEKRRRKIRNQNSERKIKPIQRKEPCYKYHAIHTLKDAYAYALNEEEVG
jgi:hypothetical protein